MTMGAQIVRTQQFHLAHHGEDAPGAQLAIGCGLTAGADSFPLLWTRRITGQELTQGRSAGLMHGRPDGCLQGFQIQLVTLAAVLQDHLQEAAHFTRDFLLDCCCRFFSCRDRELSTGRTRQIFSLTASNSALN